MVELGEIIQEMSRVIIPAAMNAQDFATNLATTETIKGRDRNGKRNIYELCFL